MNINEPRSRACTDPQFFPLGHGRLAPAIASSCLVLGLLACGGGGGESTGTGGAGTTGEGGATSSSSSSGQGGSATGTGGMGTGGMGTGGMDVLVSGPGYGLVYVATDVIGIDSRPNVEATFDAGGYFNGYVASPNEKLSIGMATDPSKGRDALSAWGAWKGGPTTGVFYGGKPNGDFTFDPVTGGFHYAIGKTTPTASLPASGTVKYSLVSGSAPSRANASGPGKLDTLTASVDFGAGAVSVSISVTMSDGPVSADMTAVLSNAGTFKVVSGSGSGGVVRGIFVGPTAQGLVLVYQVPQLGSKVLGSAVVEQ
ncbi:MAG: hypothetical protein ABI134_22570 [Byssovorax sp.]